MPKPLKDLLTEAAERLLQGEQSGTARRDAELLLMHMTGLDRAALLTHPEQTISLPLQQAYWRLVERRAQSEPIQYITGMQEFYGLPLRVTPDVLIPRPETEHLVEAAIQIAHTHSRDSLRILDIGTGSGAIALALAHALPKARFIATDISLAALKLARENAARLGLRERIDFIHSDLFPEGPGLFNLICSNPPYIADGEILEAQVADYEPRTALFAGLTGLELYRRILPRAGARLVPGGSLLLEVGMGQHTAVEALARASNLRNVRTVPDLQGIRRVVVAEI